MTASLHSLRARRSQPRETPNKDKREDAMNTDSDGNWEESSSDSGEESESDWERTRKNGRKKTNARSPAKKRARLSISRNTNISKGKRGSKSLSMLLSMPMDILFEVFGRLLPKDLIALTRTSKILRQTLLTHNAVTVWKLARESTGAPERFDDFSEQRWAWLLFGGTKCHCCGTKSIYKVDFMLRRRLCVACKKVNFVFASKFSSRFPDYEDLILDFIPHTNVGGWAHGHASGSKFYWASDIEDMAYKWGQLQKALHMRIPGAKQKIDAFRSARKAFVQKVLEHADRCNEWFQTMVNGREQDAKARRDNRYKAIIAQFMSLGYTEVDIYHIKHQMEVVQDAELSDRIWNRIRPILEPIIQQAKAARLAREHAVLIQARSRIVESLYKSFLKTLRPLQWASQPCAAEVCKFSPFDTLVQSPADITITVESFSDAIPMLPGLISTWLQERRQKLLDILPPLTCPANTLALPATTLPAVTGPGTAIMAKLLPVRSISSSGYTQTSTIDRLCLATSVFKCGTFRCRGNDSPWGSPGGQFANALIAWDGIQSHQCQEIVSYTLLRLRPVPSVYEFSHKGSATAVTLISLAGLKVSSATPRDMDQRDLRFFCNSCGPTMHHFGGYGRDVYTWRSAICHSMAKHETPDWVVLTKEEEATIKSSEVVDPIAYDSCWTCSHCTVHLDCWEPRHKIVDHLKTEHAIVDGEVPRDLFDIPQMRRRTIPVPMVAAPKPGKTVRCKRCPEDSARLFHSEGVKMHLKDKHKLVNPVENVDWVDTKVNVV